MSPCEHSRAAPQPSATTGAPGQSLMPTRLGRLHRLRVQLVPVRRGRGGGGGSGQALVLALAHRHAPDAGRDACCGGAAGRRDGDGRAEAGWRGGHVAAQEGRA